MALKLEVIGRSHSPTNEIELIEVNEDWVHADIEDSNKIEGYESNVDEKIEVSDKINCDGNDVELIEGGEDWDYGHMEDYVELIEVGEDCADEMIEDSDQNDGGNDVELIVVGEDWVDRKIEDERSNNTEASAIDIEKFGYSVEKLGRIAELKNSITESKYNSEFNKKGEIRKRKIFKIPLKKRKLMKIQLKQEEHAVRRPCTHDDCNSLGSERRSAINSQFWEMEFSERYTFGVQSIHRGGIKRRRRNTLPVKNNSNQYFLKNENGESKRVCKTFYLTTLGFSKTNDSFIRTAVGKNRYKVPLPRFINRCNNLRQETQNYDSIIAHIKSFKPTVSHYRRDHAPKKKYLPETLSIKSMFSDFQRKNANVKCSYYLYRRIVSNELNISFTKLGHEKCESCEEYFLHKKCCPTCSTCDLCGEYEIHRNKYTESRALYNEQRLLNTETKAFYSADMEKVIMLPRLDMFKQAIFTTRLSAYNDTFAPLGGISNNPSSSKPVAVIWHEGVSGRCKEDIVSAFYKFFILKRDIEECVMWLDNCGSQNKNWALFTFLVYIINSDLIKMDKIQFNYFEPGHTFMSADSFHHQVELSMKAMSKVYNFNDFEVAVSSANSGNVEVLPMKYVDFKKWPDLSSRTKKQAGQYYMHEIVQVTANRGSYDLSYKKSFSSPEQFDLNFLQEKYRKGGISSPEEVLSDCGIPLERKENILKLSGIMEADKIKFYQELAVSSPSKKASKAKEAGSTQRRSIPRPSRTVNESRIKSEKPDTKKIERKSSEPKSSQPKSNQQKSGPPKPNQPNDNQPKSKQRKSNPPKTCPPKFSQPKTSQLQISQSLSSSPMTTRQKSRQLQTKCMK